MTDRWRWLWVLVFLLGCGGPAKTGVDLKSEAIAFNDAGYQYYRQSRFDLAQGKFEKALDYNRLIDRREGIAANLNNLGVIAQAQGNLDAGPAPLSGSPGRQPGTERPRRPLPRP